jgi:hypothetical protein
MQSRSLNIPFERNEIAIANANGQWIIPPTIINHEITKRELFEANAGTLVNNLVFSKFYGDANETEARGNGKRTATGKELGQELESYIANEGPIVEWFEWSSYNIDWQGVYAGLVSVGFKQLLPLMPTTEHRPLLWFRKIRAALKLENLGLSLGNLFAILYPEDDELLAQAHYAGPDVEMLIKVIKYLFANLEGSQIPGKIENYFHVIDIDLRNTKLREGEVWEKVCGISEV